MLFQPPPYLSLQEEALKLLVAMGPAGLEDDWLPVQPISRGLHAIMGYPDVKKAKAVEEDKGEASCNPRKEPGE